MSASFPNDTKFLAGVFLTSGVIHLVKPETFEPIMPDFVPAHREVILGSGVLELLCAAGLMNARTRRLAGWASMALLLAVYPANVKMAADAAKTDKPKLKAVAFGRLPMQLPMIRSAWKATRA